MLGGAGWSHAQAGLGTSAAAASVPQAITPKAVNNLIVVMGVGNPSGTTTNLTISDTQGTTWNQAVAFLAASGGSMRVWWGLAKNTSLTTITITNAGAGANFTAITVDEFSGNDTVAPFDVSNTASSGSGLASASLSPGVDGELIWEGIVDSATGAAAPYSNGGADGQGDWAGYKFLGSGTAGVSQSTAFTASPANSLVAIASFKQPSSAAVFPVFLPWMAPQGMLAG